MLLEALIHAAIASGKLCLKQQGQNKFSLQANLGGTRLTLAAVQLVPSEEQPLDAKPSDEPISAQVVPFPGGAA